MTIETLPFERRPRNSIANNLDKINELVDWVNLADHLSTSATGESVTVGNSSSLKGLQVHGESVQDGTPTPDAPVPVQVVEGPLSLVIGDASTPIDLQGNVLASLPDGTQDELHVDSAGHVWVEKNVGSYTVTGNESVNAGTQLGNYRRIRLNGALTGVESVTDATSGYCTTTPFEGGYNVQSTHVYTHAANIYAFAEGTTDAEVLAALAGAKIVYPLATPQTIDLGYIDPPAIPSGSTVTISASLTPEFQLEWWIDSGITTLVNDLIAYIDYKTEG